MPDSLRLPYIGVLTVAAMTGCTMKNANVPPDELMRQFQAGQPRLDCSMEECGLGWMHDRRRAAVFEATGRWQGLPFSLCGSGIWMISPIIISAGAQELGYLQAAQRYYQIAERLSVTEMACGNKPHNICNGHVFPDELYPHLEVVEARLAAISAPREAPDRCGPAVVRRQVPQASTSRSAPPTGRVDTGIRSRFEPCPEFGFCRAHPSSGVEFDRFLRAAAGPPLTRAKGQANGLFP